MEEFIRHHYHIRVRDPLYLGPEHHMVPVSGREDLWDLCFDRADREDRVDPEG